MRQIDSVALARTVREEGSGFSYQSSNNGLDADIDLIASELGSYRLRIDLFDPEAAKWAIDRTVDSHGGGGPGCMGVRAILGSSFCRF